MIFTNAHIKKKFLMVDIKKKKKKKKKKDKKNQFTAFIVMG